MFGKKKENGNLISIIREELKRRNIDETKFRLFILEIFGKEDKIYLPSTNINQLEFFKINDIKIDDVKILDEDIIKIRIRSEDLYNRIKSVLDFFLGLTKS